jgi:hypothetical protein
VAVAVLATATAQAQAKKPGKPSGHGGGATSGGYPGAPASGRSGATPGMGHAPPGMGGAPMPGMGGMPGMGSDIYGKKAIGKKAAPKRDTTAEENVDPEKLPPGYRVPQEPPAALTTTDEWIEDTPKNKDLAKYKTTVLTSGELTGEADKKLVADIIRWKLSLLTRKENREKMLKLREEILRDIAQTPSNKSGSRDVRRLILKTIAEEAPKLFAYHVIARINGAILLSELSDPKYNEKEAEGRNPAVPCVLAGEPLMKMVNDGKQLTAVRIWGVNGLVSLAEVPEIKPQLRGKIVETLVGLMDASGKEHVWYQWRLAEGLGKLNVVLDQNKRPVVPQALALVLADADRPWLVRAEAAQSLGNLPYTMDIDMGLLAYETARLTQQMTDAYNKQPKMAMWKLCFLKVYGAFKPLGGNQKRALLTQVEKGTLAGYKRTVQEAFDLVLPLVAKVVAKPAAVETAPEGMDTPLANLKKWLESNTPKSYKIHPDEEPIEKTRSHAGGQAPVDIPPAAEAAR